MRSAFISSNRGVFPTAWMCRRLEVSTSGFYRWSKAGPSERARRDRQLGAMIRAHHAASRGTYRSPRVHRDLEADGERVGRKRVARLMREHGIAGQSPRRFRRTTDSNHESPIAPNVVARDFNPEALKPGLGCRHHLRSDLARLALADNRGDSIEPVSPEPARASAAIRGAARRRRRCSCWRPRGRGAPVGRSGRRAGFGRRASPGGCGGSARRRDRGALRFRRGRRRSAG